MNGRCHLPCARDNAGLLQARNQCGRCHSFRFGTSQPSPEERALLVPTLLAFIWLVTFGGTALHIEIAGAGGISEAVSSNLTSALYVTFGKIDTGIVGTIAAAAATILIATYFVTSSDSGTLVVNTLLSVGDPDPPVLHRIIWGVSEGCTAAVLLLAGGLSALQTASITAALPFSVVMIFMMIGLVKSLSREIPGPQYVGQGVTVHGGLNEDEEGPKRY